MIGAILAGAIGDVTPTGDFESIATVSVGAGGAANVEFTSIPSTYQHLQVRCIFNSETDARNLNININGSSTTYWHYLYGSGASVFAGASTQSILAVQDGTATTTMYAGIIDFLDYKDTNKNRVLRSLIGYDRNGGGLIQLGSNLLTSTSAITSLKFLYTDRDITQYSHFALYGIKG
jgi:hypothetical protein